jgi:hypothetical protein
MDLQSDLFLDGLDRHNLSDGPQSQVFLDSVGEDLTFGPGFILRSRPGGVMEIPRRQAC